MTRFTLPPTLVEYLDTFPTTSAGNTEVKDMANGKEKGFLSDVDEQIFGYFGGGDADPGAEGGSTGDGSPRKRKSDARKPASGEAGGAPSKKEGEASGKQEQPKEVPPAAKPGGDAPAGNAGGDGNAVLDGAPDSGPDAAPQ